MAGRRGLALGIVVGCWGLVVATATNATFAAWSDSFPIRAHAGARAWEPDPSSPGLPEQCSRSVPDYNVIEGTEGDDVLVGTNGPDLILGHGGNDVLKGMNGDDCLVGGPGDDWLLGLNGKDVLLGGEGRDGLLGGNGKDVLHGGDGKDLLAGGNSPDELFGEGGHDVLLGGHGPDHLDGGIDCDLCLGGHGPDAIHNCEVTVAGSLAHGQRSSIRSFGTPELPLYHGAGPDHHPELLASDPDLRDVQSHVRGAPPAATDTKDEKVEKAEKASPPETERGDEEAPPTLVDPTPPPVPASTPETTAPEPPPSSETAPPAPQAPPPPEPEPEPTPAPTATETVGSDDHATIEEWIEQADEDDEVEVLGGGGS